MFQGMSACPKTPLEIILSANNGLTKNGLFNFHPHFIFSGYFFVACPFFAYNVSQETIKDTLIRLEACKRIFLFCQKIEFFPRS